MSIKKKDKLKTFPEIIEEALKGVPKGSQTEAVIRVLEQVGKENAINWIKKLREHDEERDLEWDGNIGSGGGYVLEGLEIEAGLEQDDNSGMIKWIYHYFVLKDTDLGWENE